LRRSRIEELNATLQRMLALDPAGPLVIQFATYRRPIDVGFFA
jgi:hypothetical protein